MHGYNTALGIHHISRFNRFNLSCDLMEPFRPFIDALVYKHRWRSFDKFYKRELISSLQQRVLYDERRFTTDDAITAFALRACKLMTEGEGSLPEVRFE